MNDNWKLKIPEMVLDFDYRTFDMMSDGTLIIYEEPVTSDGPQLLYITGPDDYSGKTLYKRIGPMTYRKD